MSLIFSIDISIREEWCKTITSRSCSPTGDLFLFYINDLDELNGNLKGQIITKSYKKSIAVPSYGYFTDITNVAVEGYTPLGIVEINSGTFVNVVGTFTVIDNTTSIQFRCATSDGFNGNYNFKVLYSKNWLFKLLLNKWSF